MRRKLTLDLRLRLGQSKAEEESIDDDALDSPPLDYQSVRPPLSPLVDAELRAACAKIAHNYKPLDSVHDAQRDPLLDYAALSEAVRTELDAATSAAHVVLPARNASTQSHGKNREPRSRPLMSANEDSVVDQYQPGSCVAADGHSKGRLIEGSGPAVDQPQSPTSAQAHYGTTRRPVHSRSRSIPLPVQYPNATQNSDPADRGKSSDVVDFTPQTDVSEYPWTGSTAPTSAAFTPLRSSKRTSSQALHLVHERGNGTTIDAAALRKELERQRKFHEAKLQQESREELVANFIEGAESDAAVEEPEPRRKRRSTQCSAKTSIRGGDASPSLRTRTQSDADDVRLYFHPESLTRDEENRDDAPQAESRARSLTRKVSDFLRTGSLRRPSVDRNGMRARAASIESRHSATSSTTSVETPAGWWRSWKPRATQSLEKNYTENSRTSVRGRAPARDHPRQPNGKPAIDLNRELPPLPSLDQWKDNDAEWPDEARSTMVTSPISPNRDEARQINDGPDGAFDHLLVPISPSNVHTSHTSDSSGIRQCQDSRTATSMNINTASQLSDTSKRPLRNRSRSLHVEYPPEVAERIQRGEFESTATKTSSYTQNPALLDQTRTATTQKPLPLPHHSRSASAQEYYHPVTASAQGASTDGASRNDSYALTTRAGTDSTCNHTILSAPTPTITEHPIPTKRKWWRAGRFKHESTGSSWLKTIGRHGSKAGISAAGISAA